MANGKFGGGNGSEKRPYRVEDARDLDAVRLNKEAHYIQTADISLKSYSDWLPLYFNRDGTSSTFKGVYDGNLYAIRDLKCHHPNYASLFGIVGDYEKPATIRKVRVIDAFVESDFNLEGYGSILLNFFDGGHIHDCTVSGTVSTYYGSGFISGVTPSSSEAFSLVERCSARDVSVTSNWGGGFVLWGSYGDSSVIRDCFVTGEISGVVTGPSGWFFLGGFSGQGVHNTSNCYTAVKIDNDRQYNNWSAFNVGIFSQEHVIPYACYAEITHNGPQSYWMPDYGYFDNQYVRGSDGELYVSYEYQDYVDYDYWEPEWDETGPPAWWPPTHYRAQPPQGETWRNFWRPITQVPGHEGAISHNQMMTKGNFVGWDFEKVWDIIEGESYPFLRDSKTTARTDCQRMPMGGFLRI